MIILLSGVKESKKYQKYDKHDTVVSKIDTYKQ